MPVEETVKPTVSILIPCYNAEKWIQQAVECALAQTWPNIEIIVIDDGSTDQSASVLKTFSDRVTVLLRENRGGNPTRNDLLSMASGQWVQFLDADDYLLPRKVESQMEVVQQNPGARVIYSPLLIEHHFQNRIVTENWNPHDQGDHDPWSYHLAWSLTQTGGALFHRDTLRSAGGWNIHQPCCQDNEVFFRLLKANALFVHCDKAEAVYRRFEGGTVSTSHSLRLTEEILKLLDAGERFLKSTNSLTPRRLNALSQMRFRTARSIWQHNKHDASALMHQVRQSNPAFKPDLAPHCPRIYQFVYSLFGFSTAERISAIKRGFIQ